MTVKRGEMGLNFFRMLVVVLLSVVLLPIISSQVPNPGHSAATDIDFSDVITADLQIDGTIVLENGDTLKAKNSGGTRETWIWPRFITDATYFNYGAAGYYIRDSGNNFVMTMLPSGDVGVGTTTPAGTLDVNGELCIAGDCISSWSAGGGGGVVVGNTVATSTGAMGGYSGANTLCEVDYVGSHLCTQSEVLNSINLGLPALPATGNYWISAGGPKYPAGDPLDDCGGWTHGGATAPFGNFWNFNDNKGGAGLCNGAIPLLCCK